MSSVAKRRCIPVPACPKADRAALAKALKPDESLLDDCGKAAHLRPYSVKALTQDYGQFLAFLEREGLLDVDAAPGDRATIEWIGMWRRDSKVRGLAPTTRRQKLINLRSIMQYLAPDQDWRFITHPGGVPVRQAIPGRPRSFPIRDVSQVFPLVDELYRKALQKPDGFARCQDLRDAALLGVLLTRAPRVGSLVPMEMTTQISLTADGTWSLTFPPEHNKVPKTIKYSLDKIVSKMLTDYLDLARTIFPHAGGSDRLWMGMKGPLTRQGLQRIVRRRTLQWFGEASGPHVCRKWLRTSAARIAPELAFDAAAVLGHSVEVSADAYSEASGLHASLRLGESLDERRGQIRLRAQRLVADRISRWMER
jgi:hypothetical protein